MIRQINTASSHRTSVLLSRAERHLLTNDSRVQYLGNYITTRSPSLVSQHIKRPMQINCHAFRKLLLPQNAKPNPLGDGKFHNDLIPDKAETTFSLIIPLIGNSENILRSQESFRTCIDASVSRKSKELNKSRSKHWIWHLSCSFAMDYLSPPHHVNNRYQTHRTRKLSQTIASVCSSFVWSCKK